jgi:hypothetical protein
VRSLVHPARVEAERLPQDFGDHDPFSLAHEVRDVRRPGVLRLALLLLDRAERDLLVGLRPPALVRAVELDGLGPQLFAVAAQRLDVDELAALDRPSRGPGPRFSRTLNSRTGLGLLGAHRVGVAFTGGASAGGAWLGAEGRW